MIDEPLVKTCTKCQTVKPLTDFPKRSDAKDGRRGDCRECFNAKMRAWEQTPARIAKRRETYWADPEKRRAASRAWYARMGIKKAYGITKAEFDEFAEVQDHKCLICQLRPERLHVDHDRVTGRVRGLLCGKCNRALGLFDDEPDRMRTAAKYLERAWSMNH